MNFCYFLNIQVVWNMVINANECDDGRAHTLNEQLNHELCVLNVCSKILLSTIFVGKFSSINFIVHNDFYLRVMVCGFSRSQVPTHTQNKILSALVCALLLLLLDDYYYYYFSLWECYNRWQCTLTQFCMIRCVVTKWMWMYLVVPVLAMSLRCILD